MNFIQVALVVALLVIVKMMDSAHHNAEGRIATLEIKVSNLQSEVVELKKHHYTGFFPPLIYSP